jgi:hypothetical protein
MFGALGTVRETAVGSARSDIFVRATGTPGNHWAAHFLDSADTGESPKIGIRDPRELGLNRFEVTTGDLEPSIGAMVRLRGESLSQLATTR